MIVSVLPVVAPIFACVVVGYLWKLFQQPYDSHMVSRLVMIIGAPALIISTLVKTPVSIALLHEMLWVCSALLLVFFVLGSLLLLVFRLDIRSYLGTLAFPNIGNMGLPVCLFAFGEQGLALALALFMVFSVVHFSVGILLLAGGSVFKVLFTNPIVYSVIAAVIMIYTDLSLPPWLATSLDLVGSFTIPMMLITLGVSLAGLRVTSYRDSLILALLRLGLGLLAGWGVVHWFGLTGTIKGVVMVQAAMPTAVFNYMLATQYQRHPQQVAGMVVISTLLGFITLPWLLLWSKGQLF
ncbi:MAG: AEC family transporter [Pseudomonadales bacterium]|nr:AEC family transporter [Pseudomonadales bacterium]